MVVSYLRGKGSGFRPEVMTQDSKPPGGEADQSNEYYYGNGQLLATKNITNQDYYNNHDPLQNVSFYQQDALGSVSLITDRNGQISESYQYDAFGKAYNGDFVVNNVTVNPYGFTGQRFEKELGIYSFPFRDYNPMTKRWMTVGPIKDGGNWYQYCYSNPVNLIDPNGLDIWGSISNMASSAVNSVTKTAQQISSTASSLTNSAVNSISQTAQKVASTVVKNIGTIAEFGAATVATTLETAADKVTKTLTSDIVSVKDNVLQFTPNTVFNNTVKPLENLEKAAIAVTAIATGIDVYKIVTDSNLSDTQKWEKVGIEVGAVAVDYIAGQTVVKLATDIGFAIGDVPGAIIAGAGTEALVTYGIDKAKDTIENKLGLNDNKGGCSSN